MKFFAAAGSLFLLSGCYFADDLFLEDPPPPPKSLQERSQDAVEAYIRKGITSETYMPYGFSDVEIHVPAELLELEKLEADRKNGINTSSQTDSIIAAKRAFTEAYHIQRTVLIEHFFTLKTTTGKLQILEAKYVLNDTLGVMDVTPVTILEMPDYYEQALNYFFHDYTIFIANSISEGRSLSNRFYTFFKTELEKRTDVNSRSAFYENCIRITETVRSTGQFDPNGVAQALAFNHMLELQDSTSSYRSIAFSPLYEKSEGVTTTGYYIFHKFSETINEERDTLVLRFDFSKYYEIESKTNIDPPFESYF